jgi:transcriptional regulator with XRE-family HTH domain
MRFCERLASLRKESGLSQKDFASSIGVEASKYNKWETGANRPDYETVCMLADYFQTSTDYLLGLTDARRPENAMLVGELGLTEECIFRIKSFKTKPVADVITHEPLSEPCTFLDVLNKVIPTQAFMSFLTELAVLSDPQIGKWSDFMISDDVKYNKEWLHTHTINNIVSRIIENMKSGEPRGNS